MTDQLDMNTKEGTAAICLQVREIFGSTKSTQQQWTAGQELLIQLRFHCPADMLTMVDSHISEMGMRARLMRRHGIAPEPVV